MAASEGFVIVQKSLFDRLRQHCEHCPHFSGQLQELSHGRVITLPSGPSLEASKRKHLRKSALEYPEPTLPSEPSRVRALKRPRNRKDEAAAWFLRNVPKTTEWREKQIQLGLCTVQQYEKVVRALTARTNVEVKRERCEADGPDELLELAESFALLTKSSLSGARLQRSFANFQALIFLSYCQVLRKKGIPYEVIDQKIQHITKAREADREALLGGAQLMNDVIIDLVRHGWKISRATELFFIVALSLTNIIRIGDGLQSIIEHLKTDKYVKYHFNDCLQPGYSIPGLITCLLDASNIPGNTLSSDEICVALGYKTDDIPKSIRSIFKVCPASKSTNVTQFDLVFDVLVPSSFQSHNEPRRSEPDSYPEITVLEHTSTSPAHQGSFIQPCYTASRFPYYSQQIFSRSAAVLPCDSPIFVCVRSGDINSMRSLLISGTTTIDAVDPYGFGLLYYATYYCWRGCGPTAAFRTCKALLDMGVNARWLDEIGNTPMETMLDYILVTNAMGYSALEDFSSALTQVALLFGWNSGDLWGEYEESRGFTPVHRALLGINNSHDGLWNFLASLVAAGTLTDIIDCPDARGRSPLAWAVEYGWADATETLINFGANVHQLRQSMDTVSPLLHLVIAGPDSRRSDVLGVVRLLLRAGVDINAKDHEQWTAMHIGASWNLYDVVMELVQFGGQALDCEAVTNLGQSALDLAVGVGADGTLINLLQNLTGI